jgi:hypothetical protein
VRLAKLKEIAPISCSVCHHSYCILHAKSKDFILRSSGQPVVLGKRLRRKKPASRNSTLGIQSPLYEQISFPGSKEHS